MDKEKIINFLKKLFFNEKVRNWIKKGLKALKNWSIKQITKLFEWLERVIDQWFDDHEHSYEDVIIIGDI